MPDEQPGSGWTPPGWSSPGEPTPPLQAPPGWGGPDQQQHTPAYGQPGAPQPGYGTQQPAAHGSLQGGWGMPTALRPGVIPLRPLGLGEILDGAVSVIRRFPKQTLGLSAVVALVATILNIALVLAIPDDFLSSETSSEELSDAEIGGAVASTLGSAGVTALAGIIMSGAITVIIGRAVLGRDITLGETVSRTRAVLLKLLGLTLLTGLIVGLPVVLPLLTTLVSPVFFLLVLAGAVGAAYLYVRLSLAAPAMVLEESGIRTALTRSGVLVRGAWWRTVGILLLAFVIALVAGGVMQGPFFFIDGLTGEPTTAGQVGLQIGAGLGLLFTQPFSAGVTALLYIDRRMRAEGLDVTLAAAAAGATHDAR